MTIKARTFVPKGRGLVRSRINPLPRNVRPPFVAGHGKMVTTKSTIWANPMQ